MIRAAIAFALLACLTGAEVYFKEKFDDASWEKRWTPSEWKSDAGLGDWKLTSGDWWVKLRSFCAHIRLVNNNRWLLGSLTKPTIRAFRPRLT